MNIDGMRIGPGKCGRCGRIYHEGDCPTEPTPFLTDGERRAMRHEMKCPATSIGHDHECTCGLLWRDIFSEITAKAIPFLIDPNDPERILSYVVPCGPLHRAAGMVVHQMFDGEAYLRAAVARIAELEAEVKLLKIEAR